MRLLRLTRPVLAVVAGVGLLAAFASAQSPSRTVPSIEWIFGDEGRRVASVPSTFWQTDGLLMIYDGRVPTVERKFERIDPASGTRRPALDMAHAVASLNGLRPGSSAVATISWPQSFDPAGTRGLYVFDGDLFVLDFASSTFTRVTRTPQEESSAEFSPNGRRLAFVRSNDLYVADLDAKTETRLTRDGSVTMLNGTLSWIYWEEIFGRRDIGFWWSPDSSALAYLQSDDSVVPESTFVDFQPDTPRVLTQHYPKAGQPNPRVRVGIVPATGGTTTWVRITDRPFDWVLRVKWLPDSQRVAVETMARSQKEMNLYFVDRTSGTPSHILTETDRAWLNIHDDLHFLADGIHFLWASERDGFYHLYRYQLDGTLVNQVTHGQFALTSAGGLFWVRQSVTGIDADGWIYFMSMEHSALERHLYRIRADGTGMTRLSTEPGVHRIAMSPDAKFYTDSLSDARTLPALDVHRADGSRTLALSKPRMELLAGFDIQYPDTFTIPTRDGFPMPARLLKPKVLEPGRKYPVILNVYGGASSAVVTNAWQSNLLYDQQLLAAGFAVLRVDNRSATAVSKTLENTVYLKLGEAEAADFSDAVVWLRSQPWVDPARIGIWGWSNGGYMTLNMMTRTDAFKAGIAVAPVTDWRFYDDKWAEAFLGLPREHADAYDRASVITKAANLHGRVMLVFGSYDDNVHPQNEQAFMDALIKAGKIFEVMMYPMRKHDIGDRDATLHLYRTMLDFWKRSL